MATEFVEDAPDVEIRDGNVYFAWPDGRKTGMPIRVCRLGLIRTCKAIGEHDARKAEVVPMRARRKKA
jgi:hypothetical protein